MCVYLSVLLTVLSRSPILRVIVIQGIAGQMDLKIRINGNLPTLSCCVTRKKMRGGNLHQQAKSLTSKSESATQSDTAQSDLLLYQYVSTLLYMRDEICMHPYFDDPCGRSCSVY